MNRIKSLCLFCGIALFLVGGCATQAELRKVRQDQKEIRGLLADSQVSVDNLRRSVDMLKSDVDDLKRGGVRGGGATPQVQRQIEALDARVMALEQGQPLASATPMAGMQGVTGVTPLPGTAENAMAKEEAAMQNAAVDPTYREAFDLLRKGEYSQAIPRFREFLRRNPKSEFADNAQYWIGECYYSLKDYNQAILALNDVLTKYPKSDKVPAALLKQASAFADLGYKVDARLILQKLISEHPTSDEADQARRELQKLGD